jgi:hypothetical protein
MPDSTTSQQQLIANRQNTQEYRRLQEDPKHKKYWKRWGPYVSDRQWGTVREDYSASGAAWDDFSHDQARSRAYRWGEDGIMGISDNHQRLCFAIALWNENDPILKERLYGLTGSGSENYGNHGEDVKEYYFYVDSTPTHSYMKGLYKYPHARYPYDELNRQGKLGKHDPEFELLDTRVFEENRYFDVFVEYAKNSPEDILIKISVVNRGPVAKRLRLLPTLWFRNTWSWGYPDQLKPSLQAKPSHPGVSLIEANFNSPELAEQSLDKRWLYCENPHEVLYTENETNKERFGWGKNNSPYVKDGINNYIIYNQTGAVNHQAGTKAAAHYQLDIAPGETKVIRLRLSDNGTLPTPFGTDFEHVFQMRKQEADAFYHAINPFPIPDDMRNVQRQAFAGMLWGKQFYHYIVYDWLNGDPAGPQPPAERMKKGARNVEWTHLFNEDVISMPDKWEYPWFAAWDLAFHTIAFALIDPAFAKDQLRLLTREWYMHPNSQMPAYEWAFGDVNPPVHAWAAWRVYKIEEKMFGGKGDRAFLEEIFQKLSLYFTWWTNRKDPNGEDVFGGGFLGLDNIGPIDRSHLGGNENISQADGTAWMAMYCLNMLEIAVELGKEEAEYQVIAAKYFQHFLLIADAMNKIGGEAVDVWDPVQKFYRDILKIGDQAIPINIRSMVGLIPLFAVATISEEAFQKCSSDFKKRFDWFIEHRKKLTNHKNIALFSKDRNGTESAKKDVFLALVSPQTRLRSILKRMLDPVEFLSDYGIRALSKAYKENPYTLWVNGVNRGQVAYEPAESSTDLFGGNSNWRGPIWFPVNFLLIESLQKFNFFVGDEIKVEYPTGSGELKNLWEVSADIAYRLIKVFLKDQNGHRPVYGGTKTMFGATNQLQVNPDWQDHILFFEYFHADNGAGIGASHQTGWTGIVAKLIQQYGEYSAQEKDPETL